MAAETPRTPDHGDGGRSASDREAKRVEGMTPPKDAGQDDADLIKAEDHARVEQDARVQTVREQAREAGAGANRSPDDPNKDG